MRHAGSHKHKLVPVTLPDAYARAALSARVKAEPARKPLSLVVGNVASASLSEIHSSFSNVDRVVYYRRRDLCEMGISFDDGETLKAVSIYLHDDMNNQGYALMQEKSMHGQLDLSSYVFYARNPQKHSEGVLPPRNAEEFSFVMDDENQ
jgi:hypothetical protein